MAGDDSPSDAIGALLVGGASSRFGSPKTLALLDGEPLALRAYRLLEATFGSAIAVGKPEEASELPFAVVDDGSELRAPIVGVIAALRNAPREICVVVPTDMPALTADTLRRLAAAARDADVATCARGPLPAAFRRSALPVLERRVAAGELALRGAVAELEHVVVGCDEAELANVNTVEDLADLARRSQR